MKKENINEVMNLWFSNKMDNVHTILPGQIVSYDGHAARKAEVKVMIKLRNVHNQIIEISPIKNVPVVFPSTKNFNMVFPLKKNDGCLLLFSESAIGDFLLNSNNTVITAEDLNRFDLSDCICIPGLWSFTNNPNVTALNDTDFWIQFQNATINITDTLNDIILETTIGKIKIEKTGNVTINDGTESFVLGNTFVTDITSLVTALSSLVVVPPAIPMVRGDLATIQSTATTLLALLTSNHFLSTQIKGK